MATLLERHQPASQPVLGADRASTSAWLRLSHIWACLAVVAAALGSALQPLEPIDYWWGVRLGDIIRTLGTIPIDDPLTYTPIRGPIVDGQWLAKVLLSWLHQVGGVELALVLRSAVAIAAALLLVRASRAAGAGERASAVVAGFAVVLFVPGLAVRPQLFAVLPFLIVWQAALRPPRSVFGLASVALVVVFWANVHGSFILLYPLLAGGLLDALIARRLDGDTGQLRRWAILAVPCALAPLVNPYGPGLASYVADTILVNGGGTAAGVLGVEWGPPIIQTMYGGAFFGSVLLVIALLAAGKRPPPAEALLLVGFGVLAVSSIRHIL
jgi:hypothetical protein